MGQTKIHVGLEIGTSKTCMVVGEVKPDARVTIIGVGEVPSSGVSRGEVSNVAKAMQSVYEAWILAQDHADVDIVTVYLSVTGKEIKGQTNRGTYRLPEGESIITREHMDEVMDIARDMATPNESFVLHRVPGLFSVDGMDNLSNPEGLSGKTLDIDCHIIYGPKSRITNSLRCVREIPLEVEDVVFAPLAAAQYALDRHSKQAGALLIDMGAGTTDYALYLEGQLIASGCIPVGGDNVTYDIQQCMGIPWEVAELAKKEQAHAYASDVSSKDMVKLSRKGDWVAERGRLNEIVQLRMVETFKLLRAALPNDIIRKKRIQEVVMCGGASLMRGVGQLASHYFGVTIKQPVLPPNGETMSYLDDPRYATAIGLIRYAQILDAELPVKESLVHRMNPLNWIKKWI